MDLPAGRLPRGADPGMPGWWDARASWGGTASMSRLTELIRQAKEKDPALGAELEREYRTLSGRRAFGLNFERHRPEAVELPSRPVRRGDKVRVLPPRGSTDRGDQRLWRVSRIGKADGERLAHLETLGDDDREPITVAADDLVVVAEFRDPIHPGLVPHRSRGGPRACSGHPSRHRLPGRAAGRTSRRRRQHRDVVRGPGRVACRVRQRGRHLPWPQGGEWDAHHAGHDGGREPG